MSICVFGIEGPIYPKRQYKRMVFRLAASYMNTHCAESLYAYIVFNKMFVCVL